MPGDINLKLGLFVYDTLSQGVEETIGLGEGEGRELAV